MNLFRDLKTNVSTFTKQKFKKTKEPIHIPDVKLEVNIKINKMLLRY
jgi:hypothetical protein